MVLSLREIRVRLDMVDLWFVALRLITILAGAAAYMWADYDPATRSILGYLVAAFVGYTAALYGFVASWPSKIRTAYLVTLGIDLFFTFLLLRWVTQHQGSFFVALYLLVGIHSFYFGPAVGFSAATASAGVYAYLDVFFGQPFPAFETILRVSFLFLIAASFGFLSLKEGKDREKIERLNLQLAHRNEVLMQVYRYLSIGKLAPSIAEKVNNPIGVIVARASMMRKEAEKGGLPHDVVEGLGVILSQAGIVAAMFRNLVSLLTPRSAERTRVDLSEIATAALELMEGRLEQRRVRVMSRFSQGPFFVRANAQDLQEAILHLLNNSVDAVSLGGTIEVETRCDGQPVKQVLLKISDNGEGIRKEDTEKIFVPFFSTKKGGNGIGLGLSVALNLVKRHNGIVSVQSERGKGTTLSLTFPAYEGYGERSL